MCRTRSFCKDASLAGNKNIKGIVIEGAYFKGDVDIAVLP
jgi:hypothetical protein